MRVLIDECIDERFRNSLPEHDCQTARYAGLAGLKNGELLIAAESAKFDVFRTVDQGIEYQQTLLSSYKPNRISWLELSSNSDWESNASNTCKMGTFSRLVMLKICRIWSRLFSSP